MANSYTDNYRFREPAVGDDDYSDEYYQNQEAKEMLLRNLQQAGNSVVAGLVVTATAGLGITWTGGVVYVDNTLHSITADSDTLSASPSANYLTPTYIYVNSSGVVTATQDMVTASFSLLAIVDVSNIAVIAVSDARKMQDTTLTAKPPTGVELTGNVTGLILSNDTDTSHDINVTAGSCLDSTGTYQMILSTEMTKRIDADWSVGDDAGGLLDNASEGGADVVDDTLYNKYLIWKDEDGSVDLGFVADARDIEDYYPTGYSAHRWIGWVVTNGASNIRQFSHNGSYMLFNTGFTSVSSFTDTSYALANFSLTCPSGRTEKALVLFTDPTHPATATVQSSFGGVEEYQQFNSISVDGNYDWQSGLWVELSVDSEIYFKLSVADTFDIGVKAVKFIR